jgi:hypothetical protein
MTRPLRIGRARNKYSAKRTAYKGEMYDSRREAARAAELDLLLMAGQIIEWSRPETIPLLVNGVLVCGYRPDFYVKAKDGEWYEDVKGVVAQHSRIKMKLFQALFPELTLKVIR